MKLIDFLQLEERALPPSRQAGVAFCEREWMEFLDEHENFITATRFVGWFDELLHQCERAGVEYPKAFFLRMKQGRDGRWQPPLDKLKEAR